MIAFKTLCVFVVVLILSEGTRAQYFRPCRYDSCSSALEDLTYLIQIIKQFESSPPVYQVNGFSEEVIMKLVNALVFTATQNCGILSSGGGTTGGSGIGIGVGVGAGVGLGGSGTGTGTGTGSGTGTGTGTGGTGTCSGTGCGGGTSGGGTNSGGNNNPVLGVNLLRDGDLLDVNSLGNKLVGVGLGDGQGLVPALLNDVL